MTATLNKNDSSHPTPNRLTNPRNTEVCNPIRRNLIGNPSDKQFTISKQKSTAVNATDTTLRTSVSRESIVSVCNSEEKENCKDHKVKQVVVRSPVSSKGCKNFMCPTISATSKLNGSLKRRVLGEKNESISYCANDSLSSEGKVQCSRDEIIPKFEKERRMVRFDSTVTYFEGVEANLNNDDDFQYLEEKDHANLDVGLMMAGPISSFSFYSPNLDLSPLDADPLVQLDDLQTDHLPPGPRLLHYNPNQRIEQRANKERNKNQPDESISPESSSTDPNEETHLLHYSLEEYEEALSVDSKIEFTTDNSLEEDQSRVEATKVCKTNFITRRKLGILPPVLVMVCLWVSITNSPFMDPSMFTNSLSFGDLYVPPIISRYFKNKLQGSVAAQFRQRHYDTYFHVRNDITSFIYNSKIPLFLANWNIFFNNAIHNLIISFREGNNVPHELINTTTLLIGDANDPNFFAFVHIKNIVADMECKTTDNELVLLRSQSDTHRNYLMKKEHHLSLEIEFVARRVIEIRQVAEATQQIEEEVHLESCGKPPAFLGDNTGGHDDEETVLEQREVICSGTERIQAQKQSLGYYAALLPCAYSAEFASSDDDLVKLALIRITKMVGVAFLVLAFIATLSFICIKQNILSTTAASSARITMDRELKSCPSELSSAYCKQRPKASNEAFSHYKKLNKKPTSIRGSLASNISTMGSTYGSFTTYEKLPIRHVHREEEELMLTPVRRSSRIRNNVISL